MLTHRITAAEIDQGAVAITPDLVVFDCDDYEALDLEAGGELVWLPGVQVRDEDNSVFAGTDGWLDAFDAGRLLAFTRVGRSVRVEAVDQCELGDREVELLRAAVDERIPPGGAEEASPLVLDALSADPAAFRRPVRPLSELLADAGLARRGFSFGRAGEAWQTRAEAAQAHNRERIARGWGLDSCCERALDKVSDVFTRFVRDPDAADVRSAADALAHGVVAPAFAEFVLGTLDEGDEDLRVFAEAIVASPSRHTAPALLVLALEAERRGDAVDGDVALRAAVREDPGYGLAAPELALYELDRGETSAPSPCCATLISTKTEDRWGSSRRSKQSWTRPSAASGATTSVHAVLGRSSSCAARAGGRYRSPSGSGC